jgi:transposase
MISSNPRFIPHECAASAAGADGRRRFKRGPKRKLSVEQQAELLDLLKLRRSLTNKELAKRFGISPSNVDDYVQRFMVKHEEPSL